MKRIIILLGLVLLTRFLMAQDINKCRNIVDLTVQSINSHSSEQLTEYLSEDFTIAGQTGEISKMVLSQLLSQLEETVKSHEEISQSEIKEGLELKYKIDYQRKGVKEAIFLFDKNNLLRSLELFKMEVKTMCKDPEVQKSSQDIIEIPFKMMGNLIAIDVTLNGKIKTFILDSGSPKVILNSKHINSSEEKKETISSAKGVSGNISGMDIEVLKHLDFGGIQLNNQKVITLDLSHLEEELGETFHGLIGYDLIKEYDILFDYEKLIITLINPNSFEKYKSTNLPNNILQAIPLELNGHVPVVKVQIDNEPYYFGIDTGAESNLISDNLFTSLQKFTSDIMIEELLGADNIVKKVKKGKIESMKIGSKSFKYMTTLFSDISHLNKSYNLQLDGLLGYELLSEQKTLISYARKELVFIE